MSFKSFYSSNLNNICRYSLPTNIQNYRRGLLYGGGVHAINARFISGSKSEEGAGKCPPKSKKKDAKEKKPEVNAPFKSMWDGELNGEFRNLSAANKCCTPCPINHPSFDDLHYRTSDKLKRKYSQTWVECEEMPKVVKKRKFPSDALPPLERRPRPVKKTGTPKKECLLVSKEKKNNCAVMTLPGCKKGRLPPNCRIITAQYPAQCTKKKTPYPSFSEAKKPELKPPPNRRPQCQCLRYSPNCEFMRQLYAAGAKK